MRRFKTSLLLWQDRSLTFAAPIGAANVRERYSRSIALGLLAAVLAAAALAQTASEKPSTDVRRVGSRLACQCGCKDSVATCSMLECSFSKPAKERIAQMQAVGMSDQQIIQAFVRDYGPGIYLATPNAWGWIVPYAAVLLGLAMIWLFVKRYRRPKPLAEIGDPVLDQYQDQIEKDLAKLE
jgi:cytochrome c-type biogenesis protein CcmH